MAAGGRSRLVAERDRRAAGLGWQVKQISAQLKLYVRSQCHRPVESAETSTRAWNPVKFPVPPENVASPLAAARSSLTWPAAVLPDPASRTTSVSSEPASAACV